MNFPRASTPDAEGVLRVSKWLKFQVLLDEEEMQEWLQALMPLEIFLVSRPIHKEGASLSVDLFCKKYTQYIQMLKEGQVPSVSEFRDVFSAIFTATSSILYAHLVGEERFLIKSIKPVIQLQPHHFFLSDVDGKYHSMVLSDESISWGLQLSYPQIFQDPKESHFCKVTSSEAFPNTALFTRLTHWLRRHTLPTPFLYQGVKTNVPIRIGKKCLSWIAKHPQLIKRKIEVGYGN